MASDNDRNEAIGVLDAINVRKGDVVRFGSHYIEAEKLGKLLDGLQGVSSTVLVLLIWNVALTFLVSMSILLVTSR
jgi:hypothetical protein